MFRAENMAAYQLRLEGGGVNGNSEMSAELIWTFASPRFQIHSGDHLPCL